MISWGIALLAHVGVRNKEGIYATRFLLGLFEAGKFPAVISQLTYWYRPDELSMRLLYFCEFPATVEVNGEVVLTINRRLGQPVWGIQRTTSIRV
jgi:hypothetical protein